MTHHTIASREQWLAARKELLAEEKDLMRQGDDLARRRRELPWVPVEKDYRFDTVEGPKTLAELFAGRSQLLLYHFMFGPDSTDGCVGCSFLVDHLDGAIPHVNARDLTVVLASRGPVEKLQAYKRRMGWKLDWVSSGPGDFNHDFGVSFTPEQIAAGSEYNFAPIDEPHEDLPGMSAFALSDGVVYHTYSGYGRGLEALDGAYQLLDFAPKGRDEDDLPFPQAWWRRHDEYDAAPAGTAA
jgi:predicted dithiol-disulfide oxidoreductase (DUF899 family)